MSDQENVQLDKNTFDLKRVKLMLPFWGTLVGFCTVMGVGITVTHSIDDYRYDQKTETTGLKQYFSRVKDTIDQHTTAKIQSLSTTFTRRLDSVSRVQNQRIESLRLKIPHKQAQEPNGFSYEHKDPNTGEITVIPYEKHH